MSNRSVFLVSVIAAVGVLVGAPVAQAQPNYLTPPSGQEEIRPVVGGAELVRTPPRAEAQAQDQAEVAGTSQSRQTLPVTGGDVLGLIAIGVACIAVGSALRRYRRPLPAG